MENTINNNVVDIEAAKERFVSIFKEKIKREGSEKLLEHLLSNSSDFFRAPASTKFHGAYPGGLLQHSLNVYDCLVSIMERFKAVYNISYSEESIAIVALLHDLCKSGGVYHEDVRNVKEDGVWKQVPYYTFDDPLPFGHGSKSVYMISGFMRLTRDEAFAIKFHMGFSDTEDRSSVGKAFELFPLAFALSTADMEATYILEKEK